MALRNFLKLSAIASALVLAGCGGGDINIDTGSGGNDGGNGGGNPPVSACPAFATEAAALAGVTTPVCEIKGVITSDVTLTANIAWALSGKVTVGNDNANSATLTIQPGTCLLYTSDAADE